MTTPPTFTTGQILTSDEMNKAGFWVVTPSGATNGTVSNNKVTIGSGVSSVTVSGVFSSAYENYRIIVSGGVGSTSTGVQMTLGSAATNYNWGILYTLYSPPAAAALAGAVATSFQYVGRVTTSAISCMIEVLGPNLAKPTYVSAPYMAQDAVGITNGCQTDTTQFTAFTLAPQAGTFTGGTITVYGYNTGA